MKGTKYLSDVLDVSLLRTGELNIINAPCGCGKTTCAINKIAELASSPRKVLYLIDTANGCERLAQEEKLTAAYHSYEDDIAGHFFTTELPENEIIVATVHGARIFHFDTRIFFIFSFGRIERR